MSNLYKFKDIQKALSDLILRNFEFKAEKEENKTVELAKFVEDQKKLNSTIVSQSFLALSEVFESSKSSSLRQNSVENGTLSKFLDRLGQLSNEKKRSKVAAQPAIEEKKVEVIKKVEESEDMLSGNVIQKKKGVGYTTDLGQ